MNIRSLHWPAMAQQRSVVWPQCWGVAKIAFRHKWYLYPSNGSNFFNLHGPREARSLLHHWFHLSVNDQLISLHLLICDLPSGFARRYMEDATFILHFGAATLR